MDTGIRTRIPNRRMESLRILNVGNDLNCGARGAAEAKHFMAGLPEFRYDVATGKAICPRD
jgi:hypothetical protein